MKGFAVLKKIILLVLLSFILSGCINVPKKTFYSLGGKIKQMQMRSFETTNEQELLSACIGVLQDLGYQIKESNANLGMVKGFKKADATNNGEVAFNIISAIVTGRTNATDKDQDITVSIVTYPKNTDSSTAVRIIFNQKIRNTSGFTTKAKMVIDSAIYSKFFQLLSKSIFLEENKI